MEIFLNNLETLLKDNCINKTTLAKNLGITEASIRSWYKGTIPKIDIIIKISKYFNISIDSLVGNEVSEFTHEELEIIRKYRMLDSDSKEAFRVLMQIRATRSAAEDPGKSSQFKTG